jgi:hypothetical protein
MKKEVWKNIIGYEGLYQISNFGRVMSLTKEVVCNGAIRRQCDKILKPDILKKGYLRIMLCKKGVNHRVLIHRLVFSHSKGLIPEGLIINHIDRDKKNNNDDNLELVTHRKNTHHFRQSIKRDLPLGVSMNRKRFKAVIGISKNTFHLGTFDTASEASEAYQKAILKINNAL